MEMGMIGLGRMGGNMTTRLLSGGHEVVVYDREEGAVRACVDQGGAGGFVHPVGWLSSLASTAGGVGDGAGGGGDGGDLTGAGFGAVGRRRCGGRRELELQGEHAAGLGTEGGGRSGFWTRGRAVGCGGSGRGTA